MVLFLYSCHPLLSLLFLLSLPSFRSLLFVISSPFFLQISPNLPPCCLLTASTHTNVWHPQYPPTYPFLTYSIVESLYNRCKSSVVRRPSLQITKIYTLQNENIDDFRLNGSTRALCR
jgi:hypothetical protein